MNNKLINWNTKVNRVVVIADDREEILEVLKIKLTLRGWKTICVKSIRELDETLKYIDVCAVIMDGDFGYYGQNTGLKMVKKHGQGIPFFANSGDERWNKQMVEAGAIEIIGKPNADRLDLFFEDLTEKGGK